MTLLRNKAFQLTNTHDDYIEFTVSYMLDHDYWLVSGIGWMKSASPKYYLRLLRRNGNPVPESHYTQALLLQKDASYRFQNKSLDLLVKSGIKGVFGSVPKTGASDAVEFGKLRPRMPSRK